MSKKPISEMTDVEYFQHRMHQSLKVRPDWLEAELVEVFGDPTNVAPAGTGAILTKPSQLSLDLVSKLVREMPMDQVYYQIGKLVARDISDQLERQGLKASDYAGVPELYQVVAKRISSRLHVSEQFAQGLVEGMMQRG